MYELFVLFVINSIQFQKLKRLYLKNNLPIATTILKNFSVLANIKGSSVFASILNIGKYNCDSKLVLINIMFPSLLKILIKLKSQ